MRIMKCCAFGLFLILFCGIAYSAPYKFSGDYKVEVTGHGNDGRDKFCNEFRLTPEQVRFFFRTADVITEQQMHKYDWLSCYMTGTITDKKGTYQWTIRPIGIGRLVTPGGEKLWLGCDKCDGIF